MTDSLRREQPFWKKLVLALVLVMLIVLAGALSI